MREPYRYVFDAGAVAAYGISERVGKLLAAAIEADQPVAVPVLCLAAAIRDSSTEGIHLLDVLAGQPGVTVTPIWPDDASVLGGFAGQLGSFDAAQTVLEAYTHQATVVTSRRVVLSKSLPSYWPIVDV
jgi:hypothetical protein